MNKRKLRLLQHCHLSLWLFFQRFEAAVSKVSLKIEIKHCKKALKSLVLIYDVVLFLAKNPQQELMLVNVNSKTHLKLGSWDALFHKGVH